MPETLEFATLARGVERNSTPWQAVDSKIGVILPLKPDRGSLGLGQIVMPDVDDNAQLLSIGALSRATGIPTDTLRTWERRYGFPSPERTESGHRRYSPQTLERLRLVQRAMKLGQPASAAVPAEPTALRTLLARASVEPEARGEPRERTSDSRVLDRWIGCVKQLDGVALDHELRTAVAELGSHLFLVQRAEPFVQALGDCWARGEIAVRHEHFASERLREVLVGTWRPLSDASKRGPIVCATLPGEQHVLGLHMAALALALEDVRIVFLGADAPVEEIAGAVRGSAARAVALSASIAAHPARTRRDVESLRALLPPDVGVVAGGEGMPAGMPGVSVVRSFAGLTEWARGLDRQ